MQPRVTQIGSLLHCLQEQCYGGKKSNGMKNNAVWQILFIQMRYLGCASGHLNDNSGDPGGRLALRCRQSMSSVTANASDSQGSSAYCLRYTVAQLKWCHTLSRLRFRCE